tara:strand:- start:35 stop:181 length:147 start_codon:yes stop_codon:yes gene_type:complete
MIDAIVRISGSIFIAGIGMVGLFLGTVGFCLFALEAYNHWKDNRREDK